MNRKIKIPVCRQFIPLFGVFILLSMITYLLNPFVSIFFLFHAAMVVYFFRDPGRKTPQSTELIVSPSDGFVEEVKEVYEDRFIKNHAVQINIVLSLFDVHVTRSPIEGKISFIENKQGKYHPAFFAKASLENTRNITGMESNQGKVLVRQIAGIIARRIICFIKEGKDLQKGQRLGLIVLGSRVEIILPLTAEILIKKGEKVKAGQKVIARWKNYEE